MVRFAAIYRYPCNYGSFVLARPRRVLQGHSPFELCAYLTPGTFKC